MPHIDPYLSTGLPGLDHIIRGLMPGDNLVWAVNSIEEYRPFVKAACENAARHKQTIVYFRFAKHEPMIEEGEGITIHHLRPETGFDAYIREIHTVIDKSRHKALYIFDCLSELVVDWCSDRMLGNFFMLTCPHLYDVGAIAYFALLRDNHSFHALRPITETAQILISVYRHNNKIYVHPKKVQHRNSPTMYMPHAWEDEEFVPVMQSITAAEVLENIRWNQTEVATYHHGFWSSTFARAEEIQNSIDRGEPPPDDLEEFTEHLRHMLISRDERILKLARKYLHLKHIVAIRKRMIGTGIIGGKSVGLLLSRAILEKEEPRWTDIVEPHDSFFVGADVFCTYLVSNGCWWTKQKLKDNKSFLDDAMRARQQMLTGIFPEYLLKQFAAMLDHFGQSPIIVRSSSLLEDAFGNTFAGKYDSVFCANQGSPDKRMGDFLSAIRTVYSSVMKEEALRYRAARGLLGQDEQMGLLIQRVSGAAYGHRFFPQAAGVALSLNPYVWSDCIDAEAGVVRIVFGLGTRAVDRFDDDYTRIAALNAPERRPETDSDGVRQYAQRKVDFLDLEANQEVTSEFEVIVRESKHLPLEMFASRDRSIERYAEEKGMRDVFSWVLTFDTLLKDTLFVSDMREMLRLLQNSYECPVEVEYTINFFTPSEYRINLLQCRPLQIKGNRAIAEPVENIQAQHLILKSQGPVIGRSRAENIHRIVYVVPSVYGQLAVYDRYAVARTIGRIMHLEGSRDRTIMLLGPGRWGTTTPSLGVPVKFVEINTANMICEIVAMREGLVPDVSLGTHFFNELVEMNVLYFAIMPETPGNIINTAFLEEQPNRLAELLPQEESWSNTIRVIDLQDSREDALILNADSVNQRMMCYIE